MSGRGAGGLVPIPGGRADRGRNGPRIWPGSTRSWRGPRPRRSLGDVDDSGGKGDLAALERDGLFQALDDLPSDPAAFRRGFGLRCFHHARTGANDALGKMAIRHRRIILESNILAGTRILC